MAPSQKSTQLKAFYFYGTWLCIKPTFQKNQKTT
ncbi:MAG: hypothetical protein ACI8P5_002221, partial [Bacteroidia bacterium]